MVASFKDPPSPLKTFPPKGFDWRENLVHRERVQRRNLIVHPITYLACPYSHADPKIMQLRFESVNLAAARLMNEGHIVFSPISHSHPISLASSLPGTWEYWERFDRAFIAVCQQFFILKLSGWRTSTGVTAETEIAEKMGLRIQYLDL